MASETRDNILNSLQDILSREGTQAVTLEAVADNAGVSKGGLLYHFPSKEALYLGLIDRLDATAQEELTQIRTPREMVRWYLDTSVPGETEDKELSQSVLAVLRSAGAGNDEIRERIRKLYGQWGNEVRKVVKNPVLADAIVLVGDGVYINTLLGLAVPEESRLEKLYAWLIKEADL